LLLNVARVVSSRTIKAVPDGTEGLVWAASSEARRVQGKSIHVFTGTSHDLKLPLTLVQVLRADKHQTVHREPAEIRGREYWPNGRSGMENRCTELCPSSHSVHVHPI